MAQFNQTVSLTLEDKYNHGLLPQRNNSSLFYFDSSCRSNLSEFSLSSENRRIINKTGLYRFEKIPLNQFVYQPAVQKQIHDWIKILGWNFPTSSIKTVFTNHIFNYLYLWYDDSDKVIAYSVCLFSGLISHIAYVFYHPDFSHGNLPIRLVLQVVIDSQAAGLKYCYLGRFSQTTGFYKRNMPGFEYFDNGRWIPYNKTK